MALGDNYPKLGTAGSEYQLINPPHPMNIWFEEIVEKHVLADGATVKTYHKGYKIFAELIFNENSWITQADYNGLRDVYNLHKDINFIPYPVDYPNSRFTVRWINEFDFQYLRTLSDKYIGKVKLEGVELLSSVPEWA